jgi:SAM-dependent methyltransferase
MNDHMNQEYSESTYGDRVAEVYDHWHPSASADAIVRLKELAGPGPVLELGIGTGRLAIPLAGEGVEVHGIDSSKAMVEKMSGKPGGERIPVTLGNFAEVGVSGSYSLIYVVFNTFFGLNSQEEQVQCFANVAKRLNREGLFLIEAFVPDVARFKNEQIVKTSRVGVNEAVLESSQHDRLNQRVVTQQIIISEAGIKLVPLQIRYAWPAELDLMARLAGLRLRERWSNWQKSPFVAESQNHISVYELP